MVSEDNEWAEEMEWNDIFEEMKKERGIMYNKGKVWFVEFPLEEDNTRTINRLVIVLEEN